jgi:hypothetical protein
MTMTMSMSMSLTLAMRWRRFAISSCSVIASRCA